MKKISLVLILLLVMVVFTSGCTDQNQQTGTKYYNSSSVFFNIPDMWDVNLNVEILDTEAVVVADPIASKTINENGVRETIESLNLTSGTVFIYVKTPKNAEVTLNSTLTEALRRLTEEGSEITQTTDITNVSGIVANETSLTATREGVTSEGKIISFEKNSNIYLLILVTAGNTYESQEKNFELILKTFRLK